MDCVQIIINKSPVPSLSLTSWLRAPSSRTDAAGRANQPHLLEHTQSRLQDFLGVCTESAEELTPITPWVCQGTPNPPRGGTKQHRAPVGGREQLFLQ